MKPALFLFLLAAAPSHAATLSEALEAYRTNKVEQAEQGFRAVLADSAAAARDKGSAARELARIAWLIDGKSDAALAHIAAAARTRSQPCATALLETRILREAGRQDKAIARGGALLEACDDPAQDEELRVALAAMHLDLAESPAARASHLSAAASLLSTLSGDAASGPAAARTRLRWALLSDDAEEAQRGWRDYFWLSDTDAPQALGAANATAAFAAALRPDAAKADRVKLASLLIRAGFGEEARGWAEIFGLADSRSPDPARRRIAAYYAQTDRIRAAALAVNRGLAHGRRDEATLAKVTDEATDALLAEIGPSADPRQAIIDAYGLHWSIGMTSGFPSLHMGHVVEDRRETVTQYGHRAQVRFLSLDTMVANGYESWLWDGSAATGGWSGGGTIVQIRSEYLRNPIALAAADVAALKDGSVATLRGLADRLRLQLADRIDAAARAKAGEEGARRAFLEEAWRAYIQRAITTHEGRHAIDQAMAADSAKLDSADLEYTAKLAELSFSDYPRLAFIAINSGVSGATAHDRAGARIMRLYADWIAANAGKVPGYDPALPPLAQVDKLSDDQIRAIARAADPLAPKV